MAYKKIILLFVTMILPQSAYASESDSSDAIPDHSPSLRREVRVHRRRNAYTRLQAQISSPSDSLDALVASSAERPEAPASRTYGLSQPLLARQVQGDQQPPSPSYAVQIDDDSPTPPPQCPESSSQADEENNDDDFNAQIELALQLSLQAGNAPSSAHRGLLSASVVRMWDEESITFGKKTMNKHDAARVIQRILTKHALNKKNATVISAVVKKTIEQADYKKLHLLLEENKHLVNLGQALCVAARNDARVECLRVLLQNGANPNVVDAEGNSALYLACYNNGGKLCAPLLAKCGAQYLSVMHLGQKIGELIRLPQEVYLKNYLINTTLIAAHKRELEAKKEAYERY